MFTFSWRRCVSTCLAKGCNANVRHLVQNNHFSVQHTRTCLSKRFCVTMRAVHRALYQTLQFFELCRTAVSRAACFSSRSLRRGASDLMLRIIKFLIKKRVCNRPCKDMSYNNLIKMWILFILLLDFYAGIAFLTVVSTRILHITSECGRCASCNQRYIHIYNLLSIFVSAFVSFLIQLLSLPRFYLSFLFSRFAFQFSSLFSSVLLGKRRLSPIRLVQKHLHNPPCCKHVHPTTYIH